MYPIKDGIYLTGEWNDSKEKFYIHTSCEDFPTPGETEEIKEMASNVRYEVYENNKFVRWFRQLSRKERKGNNMLTIKRNNENKPRTIRADEIPLGTLFSGSPNGYSEYHGVYLRTYSGIVCLEHPNITWASSDLLGMKITNYVELDGELTVWEKVK